MIKEEALKELEAIVGQEHVYTDPAFLATYSRDISITYERWPDAVVRPRFTVEIQKIMRWANKWKVPIYVTSGRGFEGYGGPVSPFGGLILDLARMNTIHEINDKLYYVVVEPGVTYRQLVRELEKNYPHLMLDVIGGSPESSVLGNTISRGVGHTWWPYCEHFECLCGMEVVLPTGEVVRTGSGQLPGSKSWHIFKWGFGPWIDGIFSQSNFGVVTKIGLWVAPRPKAYDWVAIAAPKPENAGDILEFTGKVILHNIIGGGVTISNAVASFACNFTYPWEINGGTAPLPREWIEEMKEKHHIGEYTLFGPIYADSEEALQAKWKTLKEILKQYPELYLMDRADALNCAEIAHRVLYDQLGRPHRSLWGWAHWRGGGLSFYSPIAPFTKEAGLELQEIGVKTTAKYGFDYMMKYVAGLRAIHHVGLLTYKVPDELDRARRCFLELIKNYMDAGYYPYRVNPFAQDYLLSRIDRGYLLVCQKIKKALDPNNILMPGYYVPE
ncbi:MAG: hypothetical protein DRO43_04455 [Candidatus Hecatellales archaeon]|nr:MAG: hypothetical protein DRO43_04455 [Candidatus Hecatellales archaeon]